MGVCGWVVDNSTDNNAISAPSWGLAGWLGLSLEISVPKQFQDNLAKPPAIVLKKLYQGQHYFYFILNEEFLCFLLFSPQTFLWYFPLAYFFIDNLPQFQFGEHRNKYLCNLKSQLPYILVTSKSLITSLPPCVEFFTQFF